MTFYNEFTIIYKYNDYINQTVFHINIFPKQSPEISFYPSGENYKLVTAHPWEVESINKSLPS